MSKERNAMHSSQPSNLKDAKMATIMGLLLNRKDKLLCLTKLASFMTV